ncbi:MAG: response regulator [Candidatus Latescibacteria bacterium]|nr:response regulator [bacterium]MBD3423441.1 response regulator [Candidatus Latescibacterota bacterium]
MGGILLDHKGPLLIVDDEGPAVGIIDNHLRENGFEVHTASSCGEAENILKDKSFEIALVELKLPDGSGIDLIKGINRKLPRAKCIIMTAHASIETTIKALRLNVYDYIRKPFDLDRIGEVVEAAYNHNLMVRENAEIIRKLEKANKKLEDSRNVMSRKIISTNEKLARSNKSLKKHITRLKMLYQMGRDISSNENWDDALDRFMIAFCQYLDAEGASILLFSRGVERLKARTFYHLTPEFVEEAVEKIKTAQQKDLLQSDIFCLKGCDTRITTCVASTVSWENTVIPLLFKGRWLGFLLFRKRYKSRMDYLKDYYFINTIQTIFTQEVANAVNISRLRNLKDFNETILENINSGVLKTDKKGKIVFLNRKGREILGFRVSDSMYFNDLFEKREADRDIFSELVSEGRDNSSFEDYLRVKGKEGIPAKINTSIVQTDLYTGKTIVAVFEDLSQQKAIEKELRRADRLRSLGELSAGVAHEIRNPLTGIATTAQVLSERLKKESSNKQYISVILSEINRLDDIIKNLLNFAKPASPSFSRNSIEGIIRNCTDLLGKKADSRGMQIRIENEIDDDQCVLDSDQMKQVVLNLCRNAIQACEDGGVLSILIKGSEKPDNIMIEFRDNGTGIDEGISDKLYNPFFTTRSEGSGLGLSISRKIIESHRGTITHISKPGEGTSFFVELPRNLEAAVDHRGMEKIVER